MSLLIERTEPPAALDQLFARHPHPESLQTWTVQDKKTHKRYGVIVSRDPLPARQPDERWHISVAGKEVPPWHVMSAVAHEVRPGVPFAMGVPPKSFWINVHKGTLHMWEVKDEPLLAQWRSERRGEQPT